MLLFHYTWSSRQTAIRVLASMLILALWLVAYWYLGAGKAGFEDFFRIACYAVAGIEGVLAAYLLWLLTHPARFEIRLSDNEFSISHPVFKAWCFKVKPADIVRIENIINPQTPNYTYYINPHG